MQAEQMRYGSWTTDSVGLPAFDLKIADDDVPFASFQHLISTGHLSAMADRWGNVNLFATEGGFRWLNLQNNALARSSIYLMMEIEGELVSLIHSELTTKHGIHVGTGYIEYLGEVKTNSAHLRVAQQVFAAPDKSRRIFARFTLTNQGGKPLQAKFKICADVNPSNGNEPLQNPMISRPSAVGPGHAAFTGIHKELGDVFLVSDSVWEGEANRSALNLIREVAIPAGESISFVCATGYGSDKNPRFQATTLEEVQVLWKNKLKPFVVDAPEKWMRDECLWNAGQMLSFTVYDSSVGEYFPALGGYGWSDFSVREQSEMSMVLAECDWELAASSLRFVAKTQLASGDVLKVHNMRRDRPVKEFDSDNELWFLIGCCDSIALSGHPELLDEVCAFWDKDEGTIWEHMRRAFYWVRDGIGRGTHGLILIREGDWNDYLSLMGAEGRGESVMNSGMACRAFDGVARLAALRGENDFAREVAACADEIRIAVGRVFDQGWFLRGYTDHGNPVGSFAEDRVFINAQSWCALGKCGTPEQRRTALKNAVVKCHTDIGLMLMSRPYSSPAPANISLCAIPAGEGENSGIWPQTIYWMVWALAEEGLLDEAMEEWKCGTLHNHARRFPEVPFGIFNGPDCFSSRWAGKREGWTQTQLVDRARTVPMVPMIAWQGFAMRRINQARKQS